MNDVIVQLSHVTGIVLLKYILFEDRWWNETEFGGSNPQWSIWYTFATAYWFLFYQNVTFNKFFYFDRIESAPKSPSTDHHSLTMSSQNRFKQIFLQPILFSHNKTSSIHRKLISNYGQNPLWKETKKKFFFSSFIWNKLMLIIQQSMAFHIFIVFVFCYDYYYNVLIFESAKFDNWRFF